MKKHYLLFSVVLLLSAVTISAQGLSGKKIYIDPGHGTYTSEDRPMATISYPNKSNGMPEIEVGFYESNTNLWKAQELQKKLEAAGATVKMSRTTNGISPALSTRAAEATSMGADYFISIHSNASTEGTVTNYLYLALRGDANATTTIQNRQRVAAENAWPYMFEFMGEGLEPHTHYSYTSMKIASQNLGVLKHSIPGYLSEGFFHTYQPSRHRALNQDWCRQEGVRHYRGIADYFGHSAETHGYIMGVVKSGVRKMTRSATLSKTSFYYNEGTHDQWVPLNGSVVELWQGDTKLDEYTVDNNYNGVFVFEDLVPGVYQVKAQCAGHQSQTQNVTVTKNETVYPIMLLEEGTDVLTPVLGTQTLHKNWTMEQLGITGVIRRTLQWGEYTVVLWHGKTKDGEDERTPHIYAINQHVVDEAIAAAVAGGDDSYRVLTPPAGAVIELSMANVVQRDAQNKGDYLAISDIALTADNRLVACNFIRCQYGIDNTYVESGYKRGTLRFYKWESIKANPSLWVSKSLGGVEAGENYHCVNRYQADMGYTMAVSGKVDNCVLTVTGVNAGQTALRYAHITVVNNEMTGGIYTNSGLADPAAFLDVDAVTNPTDYRLNNSPLGEKRWVIDGTSTTANEFIQTTNASKNTINGSLPLVFGERDIETSYANYMGHNLVVAPYYDGTTLKGVKIVDITNGFSAGQEVSVDPTTILTLNTPLAANAYSYAAATAQVEGDALHIFLLIHTATGNKIMKFSTKTLAENMAANNFADRGIYASQLVSKDVKADHTVYELSFVVNDTPDKTLLHFYKNGLVVYSEEVKNVVAHTKKTVEINTAELLDKTDADGEKIFAIGDVLEWSIEVTNNKKVTRWVETELDKTLPGTKNFHTVEIYPSSPTFGRIYVASTHDQAAGNAADGVFVYNRQYERINETAYKGGESLWYRPRRMTIDGKGTMYLPELRDKHSGIFLAKPSAVSGTYTNFFAGSRTESTGVITNGTVVTGASATSAHIYGTGKDTKLYVYNEDAAGTLLANSVSIYDIGTSSGDILTRWTKAPSKVVKTLNGGITNAIVNGNVWGTSHGFFLGLERAADQSNEQCPAIAFYDHNGTIQYNSGVSNPDLKGCIGGAFAVTKDEKVLVVDDGLGTFLVYNIVWTGDKPTLTLRETYTHGDGVMYQMNFDYAGNLLASGAQGLFMYAFPTQEDNTHLTPARSSQTVTIPDPTAVNIEVKGAAIYAYDLKLKDVSTDYEEYTFTFRVNDNATSAYLVLYEEGTENELGRVALSPLPEAENADGTQKVNEYTISADNLPSMGDAVVQHLSWGIEVSSKPITAANDWKELYTTAGKGITYNTAYNAVDIYPESPNFGNIYVMNYVGYNKAGNGFYVYTPEYTTDETIHNNNRLYTPKALSVASDGRIFMSDWDNDRYAVYTTAGPADFTTTKYFGPSGKGTNKQIYYDGVDIASPTSVAAIYGSGADTKLLITSRLAGQNTNSFKANNVLIYNIGNADGTIKDKWGSAPTKFTTEDLSAVNYVALAPTEKGFWVRRTTGTGGSLWFYKWDGTRVYQSLNSNGGDDVNSSTSGAVAVSRDGQTVVLYNGNATLSAFSVSDEGLSTMKIAKSTTIDDLPLTGVYQMNFDYAGNLVVSGTFGMKIYSFLKEDNTCVTPAKDSFERRVTTPPAESPVRGIFAYDLRVKGETDEPNKIDGEFQIMQPNPETNAYTFTFKANENATKAELLFFRADVDDDALLTAEPLKRFSIESVTRGEKQVEISARDLPASEVGLKWAVELTADDVTEWGMVYDEARGSSVIKGVNAVNTNPQSSAFGRIYTYYYDTDRSRQGSYIYTPMEDSIRNAPNADRDFTWGALARMGIDDDGDVYFTDKSTSNPGIFIGHLDDDNRDVMPITKFFKNYTVETEEYEPEKTDIYGNAVTDVDAYTYPILKNAAGEEIASAVLGVDVFTVREGADKGKNMMLAYMKGHARGEGLADAYDNLATDAAAGKIPYHSVAMYDLGNKNDGSLKTEWTGKPTMVIPLWGNHHAEHTADVWGTTHGFFVCHSRDLGNNTTWAASLLFIERDEYKYNNAWAYEADKNIDNLGDKTFSTGYEPYYTLINGSIGAGMALTRDEKTLILQNATNQFLVFDVEWGGNSGHKPKLTLRSIYNHGKHSINQMNFDYAGNLVATGQGGMTVFAIPDPNAPTNCHRTPARSRLKIQQNDPTYDRVFVGGAADAADRKNWDVAANWDPAYVPTTYHRVLIEAPCEVNCTNAFAKSVDIQRGTKNGEKITLSVLEDKALTVEEMIRAIDTYTLGQKWETVARSAHTADMLTIKASANGQGVLAQFDKEGETPATVEIYGKYNNKVDQKWQHIGVPFALDDASPEFNLAWMYAWDEPSSSWVQMHGFHNPMHPFTGYMITQATPKTYTMQGKLVPMTDQKISVTAKGPKATDGKYDNHGSNFIANSWTAPLLIDMFDAEQDFHNVEATIYIYDPATGIPEVDADGTKLKKAYYATFPVKVARMLSTAMPVVNPLQGFFVMANADAGDDAWVVLRPNELIQKSMDQPGLNEYRAPRRKVVIGPDNDDDTDIEMMRIRVEACDNLKSELLMLQSRIYTSDFDNGWDGRKMFDDPGIPYLSARSDGGEMAVLATPSFDGTFLNFMQGNTTEHTMHFTYDGEEGFILEDAIAGESADIVTGNTYTFNATDDDSYRFRVVRKQKAPDIATILPNIWASGDYLYLNNPSGMLSTVSVYSADGKLVEQLITTDTNAMLHVAAKGVYMIQLNTEQGTQTIKHIL